MAGSRRGGARRPRPALTCSARVSDVRDPPARKGLSRGGPRPEARPGPGRERGRVLAGARPRGAGLGAGPGSSSRRARTGRPIPYPPPAAGGSPPSPPSVMPKHVFSVDMTCEGCSNAVSRVLNKLGGVQVDIDLPNKKVCVDSEHSVDTLLETLKKTGKTVSYIGPQ
ncbi:copper transport protein ATOX1 [Tenrec ecaudatus]|uniref:copper transport protein ATOX1 n=1 Tax=Tenrec ecaudatus TaxID=94439 RepID=UPI003F5A81EC